MLRVFRRTPALAVVLLGVLSSGCYATMATQHETLFNAGQFGDLQRHLEAQGARAEHVSTPKLFRLCTAYYQLKNYRKLFPCLDRLESNISKGDKAYHDIDEWARQHPVQSALTRLGAAELALSEAEMRGDVTPEPHLMRAQAYIELGDYGKAVAEARRAYERRRTVTGGPEYTVKSLTTLGLAHALAGDRANALNWAAELERFSTAFPNNLLAGPKDVGLTKIYMALGEFPKALAVIQRDRFSPFSAFVWAAFKASGYKELIFTFYELPHRFMRTKALFESGHIQEAKAGYDELLRVPQTQDNGEIYWIMLFDRGRIAEGEGDRKQAITLYARAVDMIEQQRATISTEANKIGFVGNKQSVYQRLVSALVSEGRHAAAFEYAERSKARALVDLLASKQDFSVETGDQERVRSLLARAEDAEAAARIQDTSAPPDNKTRNSVAIERRELRDQAPELASLVSVNAIPAGDIQRRIPADETLLEYYGDSENLYAFVLTVDKLQAVKLDGSGLTSDIRKFREGLQNPASTDYKALAQRLYRRLVAPIDGIMDRRNLVIVPHDSMHYLPFGALHDGARYLLDRYAIRILPSASVIPYLKPRRSQTISPSLLAFGNPDLGDPRYDLLHAQREVVAIGQALPGSKVLVRREATETAFKQFGHDFNYIHFATHGDFDAAAPLRSALLLARDAANDGLLTAGELYSLRLNADLVTLSACETGLGKIANGNDVIGLTRGFLYAGASSILASLWKVDDLATSRLMTRFYSALRESDKREALRQAQVETRKRYPHPFYWAAFQLTGSAR